MKKKIYKITSLICALLTVLSCNAYAFGISGVGNILYEQNENISSGLTYNEVYSEMGDEKDVQHSYMFEYTPGKGTLPIVAYGKHIFGAETLSDLCDYAENSGHDVRGGLNADFFSMQTGVPLSAVIYKGKLMSSCSQNNAMGMNSDGSYLFGSPNIHITLEHNDNEYKISNYNKYPTIYVEYLISSDFSETTESTSESTEIVIEFPENSPSPNQSYTCNVLEVRENTYNTDVEEGTLVLSINNKSIDFENFSEIKAGDSVTLTFGCDKGWENIEYAFGGSDIFISEGKMTEGVIDEYHEKVRNPRTAAGVRADGTFVFFAVEGGSYANSCGFTLKELADVLISNGCIYAINLDGGGSTTVCVKDLQSGKIELMNSPSGKSQRKVSNAVLFLNELEPTDIAGSLHVSPEIPYVYAGGYTDLDIYVLDTTYHRMDVPAENFTISSDSYIGETAENRIYTNCGPGQYEINVKASVNGIEVSGSTVINVTDKIDGFYITDDNVYMNRGSEMRMPISTLFKGVDVSGGYGELEYSFVEKLSDGSEKNISDDVPDGILASCKYGYLDNNCVFHGTDDGSNHIFALKIVLPKKVSGDDKDTDTAEEENTAGYITVNLGISPYLICGFEDGCELSEIFSADSGTFSYNDFGVRSLHSVIYSGNSLEYNSKYAPSREVSYFEIWSCGTYSNDAYVEIEDKFGTTHFLKYEVAEDYKQVTGWTRLFATVPEDIEQNIYVKSVYKTQVDTLVILDNFIANYGDEPAIFADIENSWAKDYIIKSYNMQITDGSISPEDGLRYFYPDRNLTRAEFAKFFVAFMGLDLADAESFELDIADAEDIPSWAVPYVKAVIKNGYMSGKKIGDSILFKANDNISREEVMYVFGTVIPDTYTCELEFSDNENIAEWAKENIKRIVSFGLISGYEDNTLMPKKNITRGEIVSIFVRALNCGVFDIMEKQQ